MLRAASLAKEPPVPAYYNEIDEKAAAWLRELIAQGHIAPGDVDTRSIEDVSPADLRGYTQCHFFAGIGVWSYALRQAGWPDDRPVWTGSCPCQPFSAAGKGEGFADERHLWPSWFWLIDQCRPRTLFGEQVASKDAEPWLELEPLGHYVLAGDGADSDPGPTNGLWRDADWLFCRDGKWRPVEPGTFPLAHGVSARVGRLRGYGNAIVPQVAAAFIESYLDVINQ